MSYQDYFYKNKEADAFFDRWISTCQEKKPVKLRDSKASILDFLLNNMDLNQLRVLEVGCFIGDLLAELKMNYNCTIHGVEPSSKACVYAKENLGVEIENSTIAQSSIFQLSKENRQSFDLIICDDVLSWVSRDLILSTVGVLDWLLKPEGAIFIRDFSPSFGFAYENHHWPGDNIYNFKQPGGHRQFFLATGQYLEKETKVRVSDEYQQAKTSRPDSLNWSDSLLIKLENPLHPVEKL